MNLDRLRWGEWIAAIAGLDLILVTFRAWYKVSGGGARVTAWDALDNGRYLLVAAGVVGVFFLLIRAAEDAGQLGELPLGWIVALVGFAATVYVAYRLATPPSDNLDPDVGLYLGLAGALFVAAGGALSAREGLAGPAAAPGLAEEGAGDTAPAEPIGALVPESGPGWSPAPPAASAGWSPSAAPVPPATAAGAGMADDSDRPLRAGDHVALTAGGARFPAGTVAEVVEVFGGGALVEVRAADGMAERFEVPESAFERVRPGGGGAAAAPPSTGGESWSPAMPAASGQDWGFDEPAAAGAATATEDPAAAPTDEAPGKKTPWWKREIGGGKKEEAAELAAAAGAGALAGNALGGNGAATEERPGFFKRMFGGGRKAEDETVETDAAPEAETTPSTDVAGMGQAAESDTAIAEPAADEAAAPDPPVSEPAAAAAGAAAAAEPAAEVPVAPDPEPAPPEPEPAPAEPEPEPVAETPPAEPEPEPEPAPPAPEPDPVAETPAEPAPAPPEPAEPEPVADVEPVAAPDASSEPAVDAGAAAAGGAAAEAAAAGGAPEEEAPAPKPAKRKRSSGSRKVPKAAVDAASGEGGPPKVGDQVALKVAGGKYDAGTKGTVVDVFSAGVIVELSDDEGHTERLDLPFEAVGPADA